MMVFLSKYQRSNAPNIEGPSKYRGGRPVHRRDLGITGAEDACLSKCRNISTVLQSSFIFFLVCVVMSFPDLLLQGEIHMSDDAIHDILEQTESDPAFQALYDLFDYSNQSFVLVVFLNSFYRIKTIMYFKKQTNKKIHFVLNHSDCSCR